MDMGGDKDAGKKALRLAQGRGWRVKLVLNTHSHADHIGGNRLVQQRTGAPVYAPGIEADFVRWPVLEPATAWGGCPPRALRGKFWMAQPSDALPAEGAALPQGIELLRLDGHAPAHMAVKAPDGGGSWAMLLSARPRSKKYHISFLYDIGAFLHSLEVLEALPGTACARPCAGCAGHPPAGAGKPRGLRGGGGAYSGNMPRAAYGRRRAEGAVRRLRPYAGYGAARHLRGHCALLFFLSGKGLLAHEVCENRLVAHAEGCA